MDSGTLISYKLNKLPSQERCKIYRKLNGWKDKSQHSKYTYDRKGILSSIPHIPVNRCVLIVRNENASKIISFLNENNAGVFAREIILDKSDMENLK